jgi:hypothetical protein
MVLTVAVLNTANCQTADSAQSAGTVQQNASSIIHDKVLGISFAKISTVKKIDSSTYSITLLSPENSSARTAFAQISQADRLFVDLPGSYGGRLYYNDPGMKDLATSRLKSDSLDSGTIKFTRDYWAVYAGMGAWEEVINCYTQQNGHYYIVSLIQNRMLGKPGMEIEGKQITREKLQAKVIASLTDTTDAVVKQFNELITSFRIEK